VSIDRPSFPWEGKNQLDNPTYAFDLQAKLAQGKPQIDYLSYNDRGNTENIKCKVIGHGNLIPTVCEEVEAIKVGIVRETPSQYLCRWFSPALNFSTR